MRTTVKTPPPGARASPPSDSNIVEWEAALSAAPDVRRFVNGVRLSVGFGLFCVVVRNAAEMHAADMVFASIMAKKGDLGEAQWLRPYDAITSLFDSIEYADLARLVLHPLVAPVRTRFVQRCCVDASPALQADAEAWSEVFRRINEQRTNLIESNPCPILFFLTPLLYRRFVLEAPDVHSILSDVCDTPRLTPPLRRRDRGLVQFALASGGGQTIEIWRLPTDDTPETEATHRPSGTFTVAELSKAHSDDWLALAHLQGSLATQPSLEIALEAYKIVETMLVANACNEELLIAKEQLLTSVGDLFFKRGDVDQARDCYMRAIELGQERALQVGQTVRSRYALSISNTRLASLHIRRQEYAEAEACLRGAVILRRRNYSEVADPQTGNALARALRKLALVVARNGGESMPIANEAVSVSQVLFREYKLPVWRSEYALSLAALGYCLRLTDTLEGARAALDEAARLIYAEGSGADKRFSVHAAHVLDSLAWIDFDRGDRARASLAFTEALECLQELEQPTGDEKRMMAAIMQRDATVLEDSSDLELALRRRTEAIRLLKEVVADNSCHWLSLAYALRQGARLLRQLGRADEAKSLDDEARRLRVEVGPASTGRTTREGEP